MSLNRKIEAQLANRPKYTMSGQYLDNQAMAKAAAFGRDRAITQQEDNLEQQSSDAIGVAEQYSNSASGILATLSSITDSKNSALRNLAVDEAAINRGKMQDLYGANTAVAEEQDKEFEYNVNMPYQKKLEYLQNKKKRREQLTDQIIGSVVGLGATVLSGGANKAVGAAGGGGSQMPWWGSSDVGGFGDSSVFSDERLKQNAEPSNYGLNEVLNLNVMEYEYITDPSPKQRHVGLMAQNVLELVPEAVDQSQKYLKVNYNEIVPVLIRAIQEQNKIIGQMQSQISTLKQSA